MKQKYKKMYFVLFCFLSRYNTVIIKYHTHREKSYGWSLGSSNIFLSIAGSLSVVLGAGITHEGKAAILSGVANEVGAVVETGVTGAAKAELVFIAFDVALFFCEFESGDMLCDSPRAGSSSSSSSSSSSPVVGSVSSVGSSHFVRSCLSLCSIMRQ